MRVHLTILLILMLIVNVKAEDTYTKPYVHYTTENGLISDVIYTIDFDENNDMWLATQEGVVKFNGNNFKVFDAKDGLPTNSILSVICLPDGKNWVFTLTNGAYYIENDSVYSFMTQNFGDERIYYSQLVGRNLWVGVENKGLYKIKDDSASLKVKFDGYDRFFVSGEEKIIVGLKNKIKIIDNGIEKIIDVPKKWLQNIGYQKLYNYKKQIYGFNKDHIYEVSDTLKKIFNFLKIDSLIRINSIRSNGVQLFIGTTKGGYLLESNDKGKYELIDTFLNGYNVNMFCEDKLGNYWLTTSGSGLFQLPNYRKALKKWDVKNIINKGADVTTFSILRNRNGYIIGTSDGFIYYKNDIEFKKYNLNEKEGQNFITDILSVDDSLVYVTTNSGLFFINIYKKFFNTKQYTGLVNTYKGDTVITYKLPSTLNSIYWSSPKRIKFNNYDPQKKIVYTASTGLCMIDNQSDPNHLFFTRHNLKRIKQFAILNDSQMVYSKLGSPYLYQYTPPYNEEQMGDIKSLSAIEKDDNGKLWVGTNGNGLYYYENEKFINVGADDMFMPKSIYDIKPFNNAIILASNLGVYLYKKKVGREGYIIVKILDGTYTRLIEGVDVIYALSGSIIYIIPKDIINSDFSFNNVSISVKQELKALFSSQKNYSFSYSENNLVFKFEVNHFSAGKENYFKYKLEGIDTAWNVSTSSQINYPRLPWGKYNMKVEARSPDSEWTKEISEYPFIIRRPFWLSWWFVIGGILIAISIIYLYIQWRTNKLVKKEAAKAAIEKQMADYKLKALQAQMNPHFISNALISVQHYVELNEAELASKYLMKFAKLMRLVLESSINDSISIEDEIQLLSNYLELEILKFDGKVKFEININDNLLNDNIFIPSMIIQPFVENAIIHGIQPKGEGEIIISFAEKGEMIICKISDNGIGITKGKKEGGKFQSRSTSLINERINIMKSVKSDEIEVKYINSNENNGTEVVLILPVV